LPREREELTTCARLLGYSTDEELLSDYQRHTGRVNRIFDDILRATDFGRFSQSIET